LLPLKCSGIFELYLLNPASPVHNYLKFSEVFGVSLNKSKVILPALLPEIEQSKKVYECNSSDIIIYQ